ncbi:MAG TPA: phosphoribosylformylglycinamidine synthase [Bacillota bacterium]|nr:phosphoribosylformylglycinamidine synthase [Bacillota bacterium]
MSTSVRRLYSEKCKEFAVEAQGVLKDIRSDVGIKTIDSVRILHRYDVAGVTDEEYEMAKNVVFSEPPVDRVVDENVDLSDAAYVLAIESLPGQYDQRADSAAQCVQILTQKEKPIVRVARVIAFYGTISDDEKKAIEKYMINPVDCRAASMDKPMTLEDDLSLPSEVPTITGFQTMSKEDLEALRKSLGLAMTFEDIHFTQDFFASIKRDPTMTEIRVLDTYWSDHCRHTTFLTELTKVTFEGDNAFSKDLESVYSDYISTRKDVYGDRIDKKPICLMDIATMAMRKLKKDGKLADLDESEEINACSIKIAIDVDGNKEDYVLMFKNETHNHPTEIEPFGGAATCLGGAIRDPLSGRSYVYQAMRVTGAGDPTVPVSMTLEGKLSQKKIVRTAAAGYSSYGNQIGLCTGQVDEIYHPGYVAKRMEIGAVVGAAPASNIVRVRPKAGDIVVLLGGRTGRDGIGGATGSSKAHDEKSVLTCGAEVQKGNPPTERKIQRLFRNAEVSQMILRCNDFGAGGVSVAIGELAEGLLIDLDKVPKKYEGLDGTELAISESQERMAVVIDAKDEKRFLDFAGLENLEAVVVAVVTEEPSMKMKWKNNVIVDLPRAFIDTNGASSYAKAVVGNPDMAKKTIDAPIDGYVEGDFVSSMKSALSSLEGCSRKGLVSRFDGTIGANTLLMPFGGKYQMSPEEGMASKIPLLEGNTDAASIMTYGFDPYFTEWSPYHGAYHAVTESLLRLAVMGADPFTARLTFQEYFERMASEKAWGRPIAALLGAYRAQLDFGTASIGGKDSMSGTFNDISVPPTLVSFAVAMTKSSKVVSATLSAPKQKLYAIKIRRDELGRYNKDHAIRVLKAISQISSRGQLEHAAVVRASGIACRVAQMCMGNKLGFRFDDKIAFTSLFEKSFGTVLLSVSEGNSVDKIEQVGGYLLGETNDTKAISFNGQLITMEDALAAFEGKLEPIFPTKVDSGAATTYPKIEDVKADIICPNILKGIKPKVFIPVFPGTNCEYDTARAFERAGADADVMVIRNRSSEEIKASLMEMSQRIKNANMVMIPGGFSGGDEPEGSGKFIAAAFRNAQVTESVRDLLFNRDGLMLGICNGFQALMKLGLLPYGDILPLEQDGPTLTFNRIGRHQSCYSSTKIVTNHSPWLSMTNEGDVFEIAISHGEGRFCADEALLKDLFAKGQVATQYVDDHGVPSMDTCFNPNGSMCAIEGIISPNGRVLGKMGHSERMGDNIGKNIPGAKDQKVFEAGVRYFIG